MVSRICFKPIVSLTLVIVAVGSLLASFSKEDAGTSAAKFLELGAGVRASSMGDSFCGVADDSTAIYWNPAGISQLKSGMLCVSHAVWVEDIFYDWISYARPIGSASGIGVGVQYQSYGDLKETDNTGLELGKFNPYDMAATLSYALIMGDVSIGFSGKYISCVIKGDPAVSYACDLGLLYKPMMNNYSLGLAVQNIGSKIKFEQEEEELPMNIRAGASYAINEKWLVASDVNAPNDNEISIGCGTEFKLDLTKEVGLVFRGGYNSRTKNLSGLTGGLGIKVGGIHFDYGFIPFGDLENVQKVSFSLDF